MHDNIQELNKTILDITRQQIELNKETAQNKEKFLVLEEKLLREEAEKEGRKLSTSKLFSKGQYRNLGRLLLSLGSIAWLGEQGRWRN